LGIVPGMASEQRIISGALLIVGVVVLVILLKYLPEKSEISPEQAQQQLINQTWPGYLKAEEQQDYKAMRKLAIEAEKKIDAGGRAAVLKHLQSIGASDKSVRRLHEMVEDGTFKKNAEGLFLYKGQWFSAVSHRSATVLDDAVNNRMKALRDLRATATAARKALDEARAGSKQAIELPAAPAMPAGKIPVMDPNPVLEFDRDLFRVFGLPAEDLARVLATKNPGGAARPARVRWNRDVAPSPLSEDIKLIPERAKALIALAIDIEVPAQRLSEDPSAAVLLKSLLDRGAIMLADGVTGPSKERFIENRALFADAKAIGAMLRLDAQMLESYTLPVRVLAEQFKVQFNMD